MGMIQKVGQIGIPVKDMERAIAFYKEGLGLPLLFNTDTMAFFECNGQRLLLSLPEQEQYAHASSVLYFNVEHIHSAAEQLRAKNIQLIGEPHVVAKMGSVETWMVFFDDTEGNMHALMFEVAV